MLGCVTENGVLDRHGEDFEGNLGCLVDILGSKVGSAVGVGDIYELDDRCM